MDSFYERCVSTYRHRVEGSKPESVHEFSAAVLRPPGVFWGTKKNTVFDLDSHYKQGIEALAGVVSGYFQNENEIYRPPNLDRRRDPALRLSNPAAIPELLPVLRSVIPKIELHVLKCSAAVDKVHVFRQLPVDNPDLFSGGSWVWHVDGHPTEFVKVLVYLSEVRDDLSSRFQLLWSDEKKRALKGVSQPMTEENWHASLARRGMEIGEEVIRDRKERGYRELSIEGDVGTMCIFATNCVHRGSFGKSIARDALILRLRPSLVPFDLSDLTRKASVGATIGTQPHAL